MNTKLLSYLSALAFAILLATAMLKAMVLFVDTTALAASDPLLGLPARETTIMGLVAEIIVCLTFLLRRWQYVWALALTTLASQFVLYHATLLYIGKAGRCPCLGQLWEWIKVSDKVASMYTGGLALLLFTIGILLTRHCFQPKQA